MRSHFDIVELDKDAIIVVHAQRQAIINIKSRKVESDDDELRQAVEELVRNLEEVHAPIDLKHI